MLIDLWSQVDGLTVAYVLIRTTPGTAYGALEALKKIPQVKEAYIIYGVYDVLVQIETETMDALKKVLMEKVRRIQTISSTISLIMVE
jgi:DNA-binding Lrp family transcriptional regulator